MGVGVGVGVGVVWCGVWGVNLGDNSTYGEWLKYLYLLQLFTFQFDNHFMHLPYPDTQ